MYILDTREVYKLRKHGCIFFFFDFSFSVHCVSIFLKMKGMYSSEDYPPSHTSYFSMYYQCTLGQESVPVKHRMWLIRALGKKRKKNASSCTCMHLFKKLAKYSFWPCNISSVCGLLIFYNRLGKNWLESHGLIVNQLWTVMQYLPTRTNLLPEACGQRSQQRMRWRREWHFFPQKFVA